MYKSSFTHTVICTSYFGCSEHIFYNQLHNYLPAVLKMNQIISKFIFKTNWEIKLAIFIFNLGQ